MGISVAVAGASGYAGGELLRILLDHPQLDVGVVTAGAHAGEPVTSVHPHLSQPSDWRFVTTEADSLAGADLVFMALPPGEAAPLLNQLGTHQPVVDLSADHRLADETLWQRFYGTPYAGVWPYGAPELPGGRTAIGESHRIANPGCYAIAVELACAPMMRDGLVEPRDVVAVAASGVTGAGRSAKPHLLGSEVMGSMSPYKVAGAHQHIPEIEQVLGAFVADAVTLSFTPLLAPMPRGIVATCSARIHAGVSDAQLRDAFTAAYDEEPFVHLLPEGRWPRTADTVGSNAAHIQVDVDRHGGRVVAVCAIDNLGKGAAGQAVQNANLLLGLDETAGLTAQGVAP